MCPYGFLLSYIKKADKKPMFFSDYGSFMHKLIELYLRGFLEKEELTGAYVSGFRKNVRGKAPSNRIFKSYFDQGYDYLSEIDFPYLSPVGVEQKVDFLVGDKPFTGIAKRLHEPLRVGCKEARRVGTRRYQYGIHGEVPGQI